MSRRAGLRREMHRDPDYTVAATITTSRGSLVSDVPCRVFLPRTIRARPYLEFDVAESQEGALIAPEFSVWGLGQSQNGMISIHSDIVLTQGWSEERHGTQFVRCTLPGEPWDLEIIKGCDTAEDDIQKGIFWLTPNRFLSPIILPRISDAGALETKTIHELCFQLPSALVHFRRCLSLQQNQSAALSEVVAEIDEPISRLKIRQFLNELDDLLLLTSLATRARCVCRGWKLLTGSTEIIHYRSRLAVPTSRKIGMQETLIDDPEFEGFLKHAYTVFRQHSWREALRQAVDLILTSHDSTLEAGFLKCFAAIETLVTHFREVHGLITILGEIEWATFEKDLTRFIKQHPLLKGDDKSERRSFMHDKKSELNRISFNTAYRRTAESLGGHGFHDDDLWPMVGSAKGLSLAEIRNRIVHGMVLAPSQQEALFKSLVHLRWCAERMIVAFLEWPLQRSLVGKFLWNMEPHHSWREAQMVLAAVSVNDSPSAEP